MERGKWLPRKKIIRLRHETGTQFQLIFVLVPADIRTRQSTIEKISTRRFGHERYHKSRVVST